MAIRDASTIRIIAELAQGFEGRREQARLLLRAAAASGADAAKFQLVYADELATPDYEYYELFQSLEMDDEAWAEIGLYAQELGVALYFDVFGERSLALAEQINSQAIKLHATDIANVSMLEKVAGSTVPRILLGAGGALLHEIEHALDVLVSKQTVILLGFQGYPTPIEANQIARVRLLSDRWATSRPHVTLGFADHADPDSPLHVAVAATALGAGARVFEKHLTLGEIMKMEDYEAALNPDRFAMFASQLRECAAAYGDSSEEADFGMSESEKDYRRMIRRHVVTRHAIAAGARIEPSDLVLKRISSANALTDLNPAYGQIAQRGLEANCPLLPSDLNPTKD